MNILDKIIAKKKTEVEAAKNEVSIEQLHRYPLFERDCFSLKKYVLDAGKTGIIAEFKRASPSKGTINDRSALFDVVKGYERAGASAISVLTDRQFFQGSLQDLQAARQAVNLPLLRKDFVIDPYQIAEAKAHGADIILLIAAALQAKEVADMARYAHSLGLNVLLEVHNEEELKANTWPEIDAIGVNNRNLKDFTVSVQHSLDLVDKIPDTYMKVSESGISEPSTINRLKQAGFNAFLIGENFMKTSDPAGAIQTFVQALPFHNQ